MLPARVCARRHARRRHPKAAHAGHALCEHGGRTVDAAARYGDARGWKYAPAPPKRLELQPQRTLAENLAELAAIETELAALRGGGGGER